MSMYSAYLKERLGRETIEKEYGFITFKAFQNEYRIFDFYVLPEFRRKRMGTLLADEVALLAETNGCKILTGTVDINTAGSTESAQAMLWYGFKLLKTEGSMIHFIKELD